MDILFFTKSKPYTVKLAKKLLERGHRLSIVYKSVESFAGSELDDFCKEENVQSFSHDEVCEDSFWDNSSERCYDMGISNNFGKKISKQTIDRLNGNIINLHGAPLPNYKGAFPYNFGIYNGENEWAVTAHYVSEELDEGRIIREERFPIDSNKITVRELADKCQEIAYYLSLDIVKIFEKGERPEGTVQSGTGHYYSRKDFEDLKLVDVISSDAIEIKKRVHACYCPPFEGAYFLKDGVKFYINDIY